jgi:hypothetical protein
LDSSSKNQTQFWSASYLPRLELIVNLQFTQVLLVFAFFKNMYLSFGFPQMNKIVNPVLGTNFEENLKTGCGFNSKN